MGCINQKSNAIKFDRQSAYVTLQNPNQELTTERQHIYDNSQQKFQVINTNNIFIKQDGSSHLKNATSILNINKYNHFEQKIETLKKNYKRITELQKSYQKDLDEIILQIQQKTITLEILLSKNEQLQMPPFDILYVNNKEGKSLIELILNHIDNYEIITKLLQDQKLSEDQLQIIAIPLFRKIKYINSNINVEKAIKFFKDTLNTKFIEIILIASIQKGNNNIIQNFSNIFIYIDKQKKLHLKFFKILSQMVKGVKPFDKKYDEYLQASSEFKLKNLIISKKIKKGHIKDELKMNSTHKELQFNIFHQVALHKKWDIFIQYSNSLIQNPNNSQLTPFMMLIQNAPFQIILQYIQQFPQQFIQGTEYSTSQGLNILHCFCLNKNFTIKIDNNCLEIMNLLSKNNNFKKLLSQPYQDQIPLVFYLNSKKIVDQTFLDFLGLNLKKDFDFYKLDIQAQILGEQLKFRKIKKQKRSIKDLRKLKRQAFIQTSQELNIDLSQELQQQYDLYYLHYIQLMKAVIKRKFQIQFIHLNQFFTFTSHFPLDLGTTHHSFLQIMLQNQNDDFILQYLKAFNFNNYLQDQRKELNKYNIKLPEDYSLEAQLIAKLIYLKQDIRDQQSQLNKEINQIILEQIRKDPMLLWAKIYGNSKLKYEEFKTTLYQLIKQLLDVVFVKSVLEISIYSNFQNPSVNIMKEFVFQELLLRKVTKYELELRNFCDSFPRSIEFNETIKQINVNVDKGIKNYQVKLYTWNLGLDKSQNQIEIDLFYLFIQHLKQNCIQKLIQQLTDKSGCNQKQQITMYFLQALLESEITMPFICSIINLNPKYFIPKIWWLTQHSCPNKSLLQFISTKQINPIIITQPNINQLGLMFDWQLTGGVQFKIMRFLKKNYLFNDLFQKSQLICFQCINKLPFVLALAIDDQFNTELTKFLQNIKIQKTIELISKIQLHTMLQNSATNNIQVFINYFNLDMYSLIYILGLNHFFNSKLFEYTSSEIYEVNKFNFNHQFQQLLKYNFKYSDQICPIFIFENNNNKTDEESKKQLTPQYIPLINYFNYESLNMLDIQLRNQLYEKLNFQISFDQIHDERIMEILIGDIVKLKRQEFGIERIATIFVLTFQKSITKNQNIAEILCRHLSKEELQYSTKFTINFLEKLSLISNQICIQYLDKLTLQNYQFLQVYYYGLANQNIELLNHLINYYHEKKLSLSYVYHYKQLNKNVKNYYKALFEKYYLVFNVQQYQLLYNTVKLNIQTISEHIQMFILLGYVEQLKFLIQQPNIQTEVQNCYFHYVFAKKMCIENDFGVQVNKFPENLTNKQFQLQLFFLKNFKRTYQQFCLFSFSKQNCSFNFYQQNIDYVETFEILNQIMSKSKERTEELDGYNELYSLIINPQAKEIKLKNQLIEYFCQLFMRTKKLNKYIVDHYENYISLFNANSKNVEIIFDFRKPKYICLKFIQEIMIEYVQQIQLKKNINLEIYEWLTEYIFKYQFTNLKLVECLKLGLQNYNLTKFNKTTLYYAQNQINLLPKTYYDYSKNHHYCNRYKIITNIMNIDELSLDKMTPIQVLLSKGKIDHINQINYSNSNLMAALISNNLSTIQKVLDISQNPKQICSDFELFHIILKFQNEKNIISFFDKYIENQIKDINKLMLLQDESILVSIVFKRQQKVFDRIVVQYLQKLTNGKNHLQIIQQHLKMKVKESDLMIYQLGISQKSYFIFEYLDGIIQADEIKQLVTTLDLNLGSILFNQQQGDRKINLFAQYYLNNLQILLIPTMRPELKQSQKLQNEKQYNDQEEYIVDNETTQKQETLIVMEIKQEVNEEIKKKIEHEIQVKIKTQVEKLIEKEKNNDQKRQQKLLITKQLEIQIKKKWKKQIKIQIEQLMHQEIIEEMENPKEEEQENQVNQLTKKQIKSQIKELVIKQIEEKKEEITTEINKDINKAIKTLIKKQKLKLKFKISFNNLQRIAQLDNLLDIEHACIYKLFGFNQFILQYLKSNYKFFPLFQNYAQDILPAIDICKGHQKLLEFYLNNLSQAELKANLEQIVGKCQQFYLIQNPIFYKPMLTFSEQFINLLRPADFNLEISLLLSVKLKQTQTLSNFIENQLQLQSTEQQNLNGIDTVDQNYLFIMSLFLNNFQLPILQTGNQDIKIDLLIKSLKFLEQNFEKKQTKISNEGLNYILSLLNKEIIISNTNQFEQLINSQLSGQPIILGMIWIQQIEEIVRVFFSKLPKWGILENVVEICFENVPIQFNNQHYVLPLQYKIDRFELNEILIIEFMAVLKQLKYERVIERESIKFQGFKEKWPQYNFTLLFKKINVSQIPSYYFENLDDLDDLEDLDELDDFNLIQDNANQEILIKKKQPISSKSHKKKKQKQLEQNPIKTKQPQQTKQKQLEQQLMTSKQPQQTEQNHLELKPMTQKTKQNHLEQEESVKTYGFFESIMFFKNLLTPLEENPENYHIHDLQAPHKNQDQEEKVIEKSKDVRKKESGINTRGKIQFKKNIDIIKAFLPTIKYQSRFTNEQNTVFMEFYHYIYPETTDLFLQPLSSQEYHQQYNPKATLEFLIYKFKQYYDNLQEQIKSEKYEKWTITIPYYIENDQFIYQKIQFTPFAIQFIFKKMLMFINTVRSFSDFEIDIIQWRIDTISLLQVLVQAVLNYYILENKSVDIFGIIDSICLWQHLQLLLVQIIYRNLMSLPKITNLFSRIYVEFKEKSISQYQTQGQQTCFLDQLFQFEQTEYRIYNKTLIITLNIFQRKEKHLWKTLQSSKQLYANQIYKSSMFKVAEMSFHLQNVINESDFFFDIFQPADLIEYLFNRAEIDQYIQQFSYHLTNFVNKDVAIIVNYTQLKQFYEDQIIQIKGITDRKVKVQRQNYIQNQLFRLKEFFLEKVRISLFEQLNSYSFEQLFLVQLSILLQSLRQNNQLLQSTQQNYRRAIKSNKSKVVEKIIQFSTYKLLSFQFGFQLTPLYFQQIAKIGDFCMVLYSSDGSLKLEPCQFVQSQDSSLLYFYQLQDKRRALTLEEIYSELRIGKKQHKNIKKGVQRQQQAGENREKGDIEPLLEDEVLDLFFEDIITIIWFRSKWPIEQNFNNEILNLFFLDQNGNMLACHEKKFLQKITTIQQIENEQQKQLLLDNLFGQNLVSPQDKFALTQIIPIIPNQINYNFRFEDQKQQDFVQNNNEISITISNDDFYLEQLSIGNFNTACYFDSNQRIQKYIKKLNKFTNQIKEMSKILMKIYFDDDLNKNPSFYLEQFFAHNNIFEEFEFGFKEFCQEKQFHQIDNSLSYLFDVPSLTYVKERIFCQIVKQIEFHFKLDQNHEFIQFQNGILRIYMFINCDKNVDKNGDKLPLHQGISYFISNLISKHEEFGTTNLIINDELYDIEIQDKYQTQLSNNVANTILLTKYLYQLIQLKQAQMNNSKIKFQLQQKMDEKCFYQFQRQNRCIILQYHLLKDFSLDVFLLDYLNDCKYQGQIKYEHLVVDDYLLNSQILQNLFNFKDINYYPQIKKEEKILYISKDFSSLQILEGRLDPKEQERGFLFFQCKGVYQAMITFKSSQKYIPLYQYCKQITNRQIFGQSFYFLISGINQLVDLDNQLNTIQVKMLINKKKTREYSLNQFKHNKRKLNVTVRLITTNIALVALIVQGVQSVKIRSTTPQLLLSSLHNENYTNSISIQFDPDKTIKQNQNTLSHIGVLIEDQKENIIYKPISFSLTTNTPVMSENRKIVKLLLKGIDFKPQIFQKNNLLNTRINFTEIQNNNIFSTLNQNYISVASFCGQIRTDLIEFQDIEASQIAYENAVFVHSQYQQIQIQPKIFKETLGLKFQWQPKIKGIYNLFLGGKKIEGHFIALANHVDYRGCEIILSEKINTLTLYQNIKFIIKLRDNFNNIYGDIESKLTPIQLIITTTSQYSDKLIEQIGPNKEGILTLNIKFIQKEDVEHQPEDVQIKIVLEGQLEQQYLFHLEGLTLDMRIVKYYQNLKVPLVFRELKIDRFKFGSDIFKLADSQFKCPLKIKFKGEQGSDDGGLRREFYNKVGEMMKSAQNGFFQQNKKSQTYFYSQKFIVNKQRDQYALIFGKLIANSILNKGIIGVSFAPQFWKLIFNKQISFEDLDDIMDENEFQNYKSLMQMTNDDLELLYVNFTITKAKETIFLIPEGDKTFVSIYNKEYYLKRIAEHYIVEQFQHITKKINEGFESVLNKKLLIDCFDVIEMHTLTAGSIGIKPENILELVKYSNGSDQLISFFQKFINQLDDDQLHDFLQFTTGSPNLPWNAKPTIQVEFQESVKETNLPTSATCFYKLTIPYYKTYEDFKMKMESSITHGQEGFGQF